MSENTTEGVMRIAPIRLVGAEPTVLTAEELTSFSFETKRIEVVCASGDRYTAAWRGVPVDELLGSIEVPSETTHVVVESADGHRGCIGITAALAGLLAFYRDGEPLAGCTAYNSRFVAPGVDGTRLTKAVREMRATHLPPDSKPDSHENVVTDDPAFRGNR